MLLLVSKHWSTLKRYRHPNLGRLVTPRKHDQLDETAAAGVSWAADNDSFAAWHPYRFRTMLDRIASARAVPLFVAVPDVVADHAATLDRWRHYLPIVAAAGPPAFVAQDGAAPANVPWSDLSALFIGGSTTWKLSDQAAELVRAAADREIWVHMGRVNSRRRIQHAAAVGCQSVDGSSASLFTDTHLPWMLDHVAAPAQLRLDAPPVRDR